jgi:hypothetical protein
VLNEALAEGRLTAQEHSERLDSIYAAKTHADIVPLIEDLPARPDAPAQVAVPGEGGHTSGSAIVAVFGGATRKGIWRVPGTTTVVTVFGGAGREITMRAVAVFGGMSITVPPEMRVIDSGAAVFGGRDVDSETPESMRPDAPLLRVTGACVFGGIAVKHKERKNKLR